MTLPTDQSAIGAMTREKLEPARRKDTSSRKKAATFWPLAMRQFVAGNMTCLGASDTLKIILKILKHS